MGTEIENLKYQIAILKKLLEIILENEWRLRSPDVFRYCRYCASRGDDWKDQKDHHAGCKWKAAVDEAGLYLAVKESELWRKTYL